VADGLTERLAAPVLTWIPQVTLLLVLASQSWRAYAPVGSLSSLLGRVIVALSVLGLLSPDLSRSYGFWLAMAAAQLGWVATAYLVADNHHYLQGYWYLAIAVAYAMGEDAGNAGLQRSATLLIGLCFGVAVLAKLLSRNYRDCSFFVAALLADPRFIPLSVLLGRLDPAARREHWLAWNSVRTGFSSQRRVPVPVALARTAAWLTWWTVAIELAIAILFLLPGGDNLDVARVASLLLFVLTTFVCVPVPAFGQILLVMLLASAESATVRLYAVILASCLAVLAFVPQVVARVLSLRQEKGQLR
jgi:hypothetical protein